MKTDYCNQEAGKDDESDYSSSREVKMMATEMLRTTKM